ncbi:gas vesicle protein [Streptomyces sp. WMMC500]|uniref:gas vesicle protein n=1 Tax=Streptomyces sp. WMMC500 TaxID=3015154 RepID=UPI00248BE81C|nr:gas vesicle protein [Streptomyces sp. WMMC500]WBB62906.1 gas vesicle protein [Streptomyces sp. WMMC500]
MTGPATRPAPGPVAQRQTSLVDLLDRLLGTGVVISGDLVLRVADVDLVRIRLHALLASVAATAGSPWPDDDLPPRPYDEGAP